MEKLTDWEVNNLVKELRQGQEVARQLQAHLSTGQMDDTHFLLLLLDRIISSYDHALSMLHYTPPPPDKEDSDQDSIRKRKVRVTPGTGGIDDGYAWRKYGQKDILGATHPRGYYRCTHRYEQGCLATKQVQRSDEDPNTYIVTYSTDHTCNPHAPPGPNPNPLPDNPLLQSQVQEPLFDIQTSLGMVGPDLTTNQNQLFPQSDNIFGDYCPLDSSNFEGLIPNLMQTTLSELSSVVQSGTNSAAAGTSFLGESSKLGSNFVFGNPGYYPSSI